MDVVVDTFGSYLLDIAVKPIEDSLNGSTVELELIFEERTQECQAIRFFSRCQSNHFKD